ncbi:MAG: ABC transporter permease [Alphaproteobacteria bacterium]
MTSPDVDQRDGWLNVHEEAGMLTVEAGGRWNIATAQRFERTFDRLGAFKGKQARLDLGAVESLDTAGAFLLHRLTDQLKAGGVAVEVLKLSEAQEALITRVAHLEPKVEIEPRRRNPLVVILERIGRGVADVVKELQEGLSFLGRIVVSFLWLLRHPHRLRVRAVVYHMEQSGLNAVPIVALIAFLIGVVIAYQGSLQLTQFGAQIFVVDLVAVSVLRELGILLTAIIVAGRSGSAYTAQIGAMRINEEVDAMRTIGLDPMQVLVLPRVIALMITLPLLGFIADIMGLIGGAVMANIELGISPGAFVERLGDAFSPWSLGVGLIKAPVFAGIIALTGCYMGMKVSGSAESVGLYTTRAVVHGIFAVIVVDAIFSVFFAYIGI